MTRSKPEAAETTYPLRAAARLTGLSPDVLRAWERRHGVVAPLRTPGGTRRYRAADLERLRLMKAAVDAGHRIGQVAGLGLEELRRRAVAGPPARRPFDAVLAALDRLDGPGCQRLLSLQLSALGAARFAREVAGPLVHEIGEGWARGRLSVAAEHLATGVLRSLLGSALQPTASSLRGPCIVFATPSGERHELGLLMAALTALGAGAHPLYLGVEVPAPDLLGAVERSGAEVLALSLVALPASDAARAVGDLRAGLAQAVALWLGGAGAGGLELPPGVERIHHLDELEQRVVLLGLARVGER